MNDPLSTPPPSTKCAQKYFLHPLYPPLALRLMTILPSQELCSATYNMNRLQLLPWWSHFTCYGWWWWWCVAETSRKRPLRCFCKRLSTQSGRLKQKNLYKSSTWRTTKSGGSRPTTKLPSVHPNSVQSTQLQRITPPVQPKFIFQSSTCRSRRGQQIVCWLILSPMDHSFMPKWTWKAFQSEFKAWWFHPGAS